MAKWSLESGQKYDFATIVKYAVKKRKQVYFPNADFIDQQPLDFLALPVYIQSELLGILAIKVKHKPESQHADTLNALNQNIKWLVESLAHTRRGAAGGAKPASAGLGGWVLGLGARPRC